MTLAPESIPCVSFIGIVDFTENAKWLYCSESVQDLLGFESHELVGTPSIDLVHPDEFIQVKQLHYDTIRQDKAAVLAYLRMRHKDPFKGYILCAISRTVVHNVLAGSVSYATPGPKAMHNASTAQEVTIITPTAKDFEFRRWNDPSPMPPCVIPSISKSSSSNLQSSFSSPSPSTSDSSEDVKDRLENPIPSSFFPLPVQSIRTLLILDRFSVNCHILYCSNDSLLETTAVMGRSLYDFVVQKDEDLVRCWVDLVKGWGVNEYGQPSDGGFGFGKFRACPGGRDSSSRQSETQASRRPGRREDKTTSRTANRRKLAAPGRKVRHTQPSHLSSPESEVLFDAIFSAHSDGLMIIIRKAT